MVNLLLAIIYLAFISLGLPDALLGAAWPTMYGPFNVPISAAGIISMIISIGTVISSLFSERLTSKLGAGKVTAISVAVTAISMWGFSVSNSFWMLCILAVPYGLGAGCIDAALNNYVAINYESKHMSWLHAMWGIGISVGPYIMGYALSRGMSWNRGYLIIAIIQVVLTIIMVFSLPLWKKGAQTSNNSEAVALEGKKPLTIRETISIPGAKSIMITFFCYCALEQTAILWGSSFLVMTQGIEKDMAANFASLFCIGITVGRILSGFATMRLKDYSVVRLGQGIIVVGILCVLLQLNTYMVLAGLVLIGFGCAPVYPCVMHSTPIYFGTDKSQAVIGVQMASAYVGTSLMPPLFGLIANHIDISLLPIYLLVLLLVMVVFHERLVRRFNCGNKKNKKGHTS